MEISLDQKKRKLVVRPPSTESRFWEFLLIDIHGDLEPFPVDRVDQDRTPQEIARSPRSHLYNFVSSNWLDTNWNKEVEPQIIRFVEENKKEGG